MPSGLARSRDARWDTNDCAVGRNILQYGGAAAHSRPRAETHTLHHASPNAAETTRTDGDVSTKSDPWSECGKVVHYIIVS